MKKNKSNDNAKLGDSERGRCVECGQPCLVRDEYIVRGKVWHEAGMPRWDSGYLHRHCLEKRIGRKLTQADLLMWAESESEDGETMNMRVMPDYQKSPEFLLGSGGQRVNDWARLFRHKDQAVLLLEDGRRMPVTGLSKLAIKVLAHVLAYSEPEHELQLPRMSEHKLSLAFRELIKRGYILQTPDGGIEIAVMGD
jgi:hypothetical protein